MTPEQILDELRQADPAERVDILNRALQELGPEGVRDLIAISGDQLTPNEVERLTNVLEAGPDPVTQAIEDIDDQEQFTEDRQLEEDIAQLESDTAGLSDSQRAAVAEERGLGDHAGLNAPRWVLDNLNGGMNLTPEQQRRILRDVNFENFGGERFSSWDDLIKSGYLDDSTADTVELVKNAIADTEPIEAFEVPLSGGRKTSISATEFAAMTDVFGVDRKGLVYLTQLTDRKGLTRQGTVPVAITAALLKAGGMLDLLTSPTAPPITSPTRDPRTGRPAPVPPFSAIDVENERLGTETYQMTDQYPNVPDAVLRAEGDSMNRFGKISPNEVFRGFSEGLEMYRGDAGMAFVHALDPGLARRVGYSGGDPTKMNSMDMYDVRMLLSAADLPGVGTFRQVLQQAGFGPAETAFSDFWSYLEASDINRRNQDQGGAEAAAEEPETVYPDPTAIDETLRTLYQQLYDTEPDDATMAKFRSQINAAVAGARDNNLSGISIEARARQFARQDPKYAGMYGSKPDGMTETQWAQQFESAQASMLGAERAGNLPKHLGMRAGKYQTTIGAAAATSEAWDNSTFLGRLARAGQIVSENT